MTRPNWLLLGLGILLMLLSSREWNLTGTGDDLPTELANEPDLYMEDAVIDEFDASGALRYRLDAKRVSHFPDRGLAIIDAPRFELTRTGQAPWRARADAGRVHYEAADRSGQTITLTEAVVLERDDGNGKFVRLETSELEIELDGRRVRASQGVKISNEAGHTVADRLEGALDDGQLKLFSNGSRRVTTVVDARAG